MDDKKLQALVDDHARMGMRDAEIRTHLWDPSRDGHGIDPARHIPMPSRAAQADRDYLFATGAMRTPPKNGQVTFHSGSNTPPEGIALPQLAEMMQRLNQREEYSPVGSYPEDEMEDVELFSHCYKSQGLTFLDRLIHGFGPVMKHVGEHPDASNYEICKVLCKSAIDKNFGGMSMVSPHDPAFTNASLILQVFTAIAPWFSDQVETDNIQVDGDLVEAFLEARRTAPVEDLPTKPFYIDVRSRGTGQRALSGIFCWPCGDTFAYMAVIEWSAQGYEAFAFGELDKPGKAYVSCPTEDHADAMSLEQIDMLYGMLHEQIHRIVVMAHQYHRTQVAIGRPLPALSYLDPRTPSDASKKARNKEKTHSYFRIQNIATPQDVQRRTHGRNSWSLDHLITVNGHLRWQPYGPSNSLRKLIWIDAYDKGEGTRHRPATNPTLDRMRC